MTREHLNVARFAQIEKSVRRSPFRKGSVRDKAWNYLQKPRTYKAFHTWARRIGVNPTNLLRALRRLPVLVEEGTTLRLE